jgi:hypothetical protein
MNETLVQQPLPRPPKINWIPAYGGLVKEKPGFAREQKWHEKHHVPYVLPDSQDAQAEVLPDQQNLRVGE